MLTPGFSIKNETIWPLQISLSQVGPLYFDVIMPGQTFTRDTGAVWFTLRASVFLDEKDRITDWDAIMPVAIIVGTVILAAVTAGAAAYAGGPALVTAGMAGTAGVTGLSSASALATATAASALVGAGFSASAALVIGGAVVGGGIGAAVSASTQAALKEIFNKDNVSVSSAGCYAGPPWPFRRDITPLRITGGPTLRQVPGKDQVEIIGGTLQINTPEPPTAYSHFSLQTGTAMAASNADFRFFVAHNNDLVAIQTANTGSGMTEVHILTAASDYKSFSVQTKTALALAGPSWEFGIAQNNDVFAINKSNTGSGTTEVHVLSAAHDYQKFATQTKTALGTTDASWAFVIAHNRDVVAIKKNGGESNSTELHILSAKHNFQTFVIQTKTALPESNELWSFDIAHNRDVFAFKKNGTDSGTCELHILAAHAGYQEFTTQTKTALHEVDNTWELRVAEDRQVFAIRKSGGASNSTEVHVLHI